MSASVSIRRAAIFVECGLTGCGPTRPCSRSSAPTSRGKPKCAARSRVRQVRPQKVGLTLDEIGHELAKLPPFPTPTRGDWARLTTDWSARIDDRIAELRRLQHGLTECIGCGCLSLDRCRLANPHDRAGRLGPGPRYWIGDRPGG